MLTNQRFKGNTSTPQANPGLSDPVAERDGTVSSSDLCPESDYSIPGHFPGPGPGCSQDSGCGSSPDPSLSPGHSDPVGSESGDLTCGDQGGPASSVPAPDDISLLEHSENSSSEGGGRSKPGEKNKIVGEIRIF